MIMTSYSIDTLKRSAFQSELTNVLNLLPKEEVNQQIFYVIDYLNRRIKEIEREHNM